MTKHHIRCLLLHSQVSDGDKRKYRSTLHAVSRGIPDGSLSEIGSAAWARLPQNPGKFFAFLARPLARLSPPTPLAAQGSSRYGGTLKSSRWCPEGGSNSHSLARTRF